MKKLVLVIIAVCAFSAVAGAQTNAAQAFNAGVKYLQSQNYTEAVKWFRKAADQGHAEAQYNLGVMYEKGMGVSQSYSEAVKWFRKAADQGVGEAQYNLGVMYKKGEGVSQSYSEAVKWYRKAADQGVVEAQYNLGVMYEKGEGVSQSYTEAAKWYRKAADQGYAAAQYNLGVMYEKGEGVSQSYSEAVKWYRKAADQGYAAAQFSLGMMYENGEGVNVDMSEALRWYEEASKSDERDAKSELAVFFAKTRMEIIQEDWAKVSVSSASSSKIFLDGKELTFLNQWTGYLEKGKQYVFESVRAGCRNGSLLVNVDERNEQTYTIPDPTLVMGTFRVMANDKKAKIYVSNDSGYHSAFPVPVRENLPIGTYSAYADSPDSYTTASQRFEIKEGEDTSLSFRLKKISWLSIREDYDFSGHFIDIIGGFAVDNGVKFNSLGLQYAICRTHLGGYVSGMYNFTRNHMTSATAGAVLRFTSDWRKVDFQMYAGPGVFFNPETKVYPGGEIGFRLSARNKYAVSFCDLIVGVQASQLGVMPTVGISVILPIGVTMAILAIPFTR